MYLFILEIFIQSFLFFASKFIAMSQVGDNTRPGEYGTYNTYAPSGYGENSQFIQGTYGTSSYVAGSYNPSDLKLNQSYQTGTGYSQVGQSRAQRAIVEEIPVESRIEYIPFEKKYIEYDQVERIERIPYEREIVEYEEVIRTQRVPVERTITDYYAVQTQIEYIPKQIEETIVEYEPVERVWERVQYLPVETQIVYYPERDNFVPKTGNYVQAGYPTSAYQQGSTYVPSKSGVRTQNQYQTEYQPTGSFVPSGGSYGYTTGVQETYSTGQRYNHGQTYATGASGVRGENVFKNSQTEGYAQGTSGVRQY